MSYGVDSGVFRCYIIRIAVHFARTIVHRLIVKASPPLPWPVTSSRPLGERMKRGEAVMKKSNLPINLPVVQSARNDLSPKLVIVERPPKELRKSKRRVRKVKPKHVKRLIASIRKFGFIEPVLLRGTEIVNGHIRVAAARQLGLETIPCIDAVHLSKGEIRLLRMALNKLQEGGTWDEPALKLEFTYQLQINTDISVTGFKAWEVDAVLEIGPGVSDIDPVDQIVGLPDPKSLAVTQPGDLWRLGYHFISCGNARSEQDLHLLVGNVEVALVFTDPPYNVLIFGNVSSSKIHPEFHEASGEMTPKQFEDFLVATLGPAADRLGKGGLLYAFIDWRHMNEMSAALRRIGLIHKQLCVWVKEYPGMGSFYRSQFEQICIAIKPGASHVNNIQLGAHGRNRSNVWQFPGATGGQADDVDDFKVHPTVKPVRLIEEALLDVTGAGDYVLDPFLGSGSTLLAAERTQRRCLGLEISPAYVDVAIRRWQDMTGETAVHVASGQTFAVREKAPLEKTPCEEEF
jgi:DNA modification methylase